MQSHPLSTMLMITIVQSKISNITREFSMIYKRIGYLESGYLSEDVIFITLFWFCSFFQITTSTNIVSLDAKLGAFANVGTFFHFLLITPSSRATWCLMVALHRKFKYSTFLQISIWSLIVSIILLFQSDYLMHAMWYLHLKFWGSRHIHNSS